MSSTSRGYNRHKADYYVTPHKPIKDFLSEFLQDEAISRPDRMFWLDPCAGGCAYEPMSYPAVIKEAFGEDAMTIDAREDSRADIKADYLSYELKSPRPDIIITNPPFNIALEIVKKALTDVKPGGYVVMLLRLNFFGSQERKSFFDEHMPKYCYVHRRRLNFITKREQERIKKETGKSATGDSIEYAHFVWQQGINPEFTLTKII